ncbi:MAG: thioredoxin family protein [Bacteroidales bacterium]|nr:thioredoxin family protein [Bacteroidales bacterium]
MKRLLFFTLLLVSLVSLSNAQIYDPVDWSFSYEKVDNNTWDIIFTAEIEEHSHLYSINLPEDNIAIPTSFTVEESDLFKIVREVYEVDTPDVVFNDLGYDDVYFSESAEFRMRITSELSSFTVSGYVTYMACDDERCSPPQDVEFSVALGGESVTAEPGSEKMASASEGSAPGAGKEGMLRFFIISLLAGLAGILTPCVFPMIPMTVAFFSRGAGNRIKSVTMALVFGLSIVLVYSSLGIIVSLTSAGAGFASTLSTHWIPNLLFFLFFIIFAASFFGAFELVLPNRWISSTDSKVDKGGVLAAFFLGITTVLVSFSCTGPIVGALLVEAASGDVLRPTIGMFGFGLAFALPFTIFALFPSVLNKLPKSGGWLNSVKVVLGFLMVAFGLKFLSIIDAVYGLGFMGRDIFLAIWIVLFSLLGLYLMGRIRFAHDSKLDHIGVFRLLMIVVVFSFVVYLIPGLFGAPLKGLSGFLPAPETSSFRMMQGSNPTSGAVAPFNNEGESSLCGTPKYAENVNLHLPYGLQGYYEYEQGMACAREKGLPVLLDFKGHACANCKEMEGKVWSDPEVLRRLSQNFVIIALYTDDRTKLPEEEWRVSPVDGKMQKTMGKVNADLEIEMFGTNTQPLYVITDHDGNALNDPMQLNLDIQEYIEWLDEGVRLFNE